MPEDFSSEAIGVDDLPDFSGEASREEFGNLQPLSPIDRRRRLWIEQAEARQDQGPIWLRGVNALTPAVEAAHAFPANVVNLPSLIAGGHPIVAPGQPIVHVPVDAEDIAQSIRRSPVLRGSILGANPELTGGVTRGVMDVGEGFTTPEMAGLAGSLPKAAPLIKRAVSAGFAAEMGSHVPEAAAQFGEATVTQPPAEQFRAATSLAAQIALPTLLGVHGEISTRPPLLLPRSLEALREVGVRAPEAVVRPTGDIAITDRLSAIDAQLAQFEKEHGPRSKVVGMDETGKPKIEDRILRTEEDRLLKLREQLIEQQSTKTTVSAKIGDRVPAQEKDAEGFYTADAAQAFADSLPVGSLVTRFDGDVFRKNSEGTWDHQPEYQRPGNNSINQGTITGGTLHKGTVLRVGKSEPKQTEVPSAVQEQKTGTILRDVPEQPVSGQSEVPAAPGSGGIPRSVETAAETPKPSEVPLESAPPVQAEAPKTAEAVLDEARSEVDRLDAEQSQARTKLSEVMDREKEIRDKLDSYEGTTEGKNELQRQLTAVTGEVTELMKDATEKMAAYNAAKDKLPEETAQEGYLREQRTAKKSATEPPIGEGPGAKTAGAPKYPAIQQLTDQLEATPKVGTKERLRIGEKIADAWSKKGDLWTKAVGRMTNAKNAFLKWQEGIRRASDLDSRLGEYDYAIQYSSAASKRAGHAIERQMRDVTDREAAAILIDSARIAKDPGNPAEVRQVIKDGLDLLPADTPKRVRAAMERALDPSLELRQFTEGLKQYFGIREQDAIGADLFSQGLSDYYTHVWKKESNMPSSLRNAIATGRLNTYFQFARQRKIPTLIEGILEGKTPILDPAKVIPFYNFAMDRAIASRTFIEKLHDMKGTDGRPAVDVRGGVVIQDPLDVSSPVMVKPKTQAHEISDYRPINHPAMQKWKWTTKTPEGRDVMLRGDMVVHPEFHESLARFMDRDRLTASKAMQTALLIGATAKTAKLGLLPSTFHIVHVGTHAAFHWTNPFKWAPIDFEAPATRFAIEKGHLKLAPSPAELALFEEGISGGLLRKIPLYGKWIGAFSDFMFHQYIPRLKLNTFENAMARARSPLTTTGRALRAGRMTENDLAARIGDASNSAFGELNSLFLNKFGRSPEMQRMLRLIFLAPDFGEARLRFATKTFARYGDEERLAIATMLGVLWFGARLGNWLSHGNAEADDPRHAFEVKMKDQAGLLGKKGANHWVGMRSVVGDVAHLVDRPGQFMYVRLSPAYSRPTTDFLFGRDERTGRKLNWEEKAVRIAQAWQPIGLGGMTEPDRTMHESLFQSIGLSNRRDRLVSDVARKANQWREKQGLFPVVEVIPTDEPSYLKLRTALNVGKYKDAQKMLDSLKKTRSMKQIEKAMVEYLEQPYTGSLEHEKAWASTWTKQDAELYLEARKEKENTLVDFYKLLGGTLK